MILNIKSLCGDETILAGAQLGRRLFAELAAAASPTAEPQPIFLDFSGVLVATSSFLRESIIAFRDYVRSGFPSLYPVVANADEGVLEELAFFLNHRADAVWACDLTPGEDVSRVRLLGRLDDVQKATFDSVARLGSTSAPALAALKTGGAEVGATAWNNRLQSLATRGLLVERRFGKTKSYSPVLEMNDGG